MAAIAAAPIKPAPSTRCADQTCASQEPHTSTTKMSRQMLPASRLRRRLRRPEDQVPAPFSGGDIARFLIVPPSKLRGESLESSHHSRTGVAAQSRVVRLFGAVGSEHGTQRPALA